MTTSNPILFNPILLGFLTLTLSATGCTVVQDYGEDYLEWRDLGFDTASPPTPDTINEPEDVSDTVEPTDTSPSDTAEVVDSNEPDSSEPDIADVSLPADVEVDANSPSSVWSKDALFDVRGYIRLIEYHDNLQGKTAANEIQIHVQSEVPPNKLTLIAESGGCRLYLLDKEACPPPCPEVTPNWLDVGSVSISGLSSVLEGSVQLAYGQDGEYNVQGAPIIGANLFGPGDNVTIEVEGGAGFDELDVKVTGVSDMKHKNSQVITLTDVENYLFSWEPTGQNEVVELTLRTGPWQDGETPEGVITCAANDADGFISIPAELIQKFPTSDGLTPNQHPSMARRIHRTVVETDAGPLDVSIISETYLVTVH